VSPAPSSIAVVFNPSKASNAEHARREICDALLANGFPEPHWFETTVEDPGAGVCRQAVDEGAELVFASGGDGTVMACVTALAGGKVPLAVLVAGTGNLLARNFGLPQDLKEAAGVAARDNRISIDVGTLGERRFAIMAGMGFDAEMLADAPEGLKARVGWPAYVVSATRHLLERRHTFTLVLDEREPLQRRGRGVLVGNVGKLQGGLPVLPAADPLDGLLDVAVIQPKGLLSWAVLALRVVLRRGDQRRLETWQARSVTVRCDERLATEVDGEVIGDADVLEIGVLPGTLQLLVP
jgi:YegS/Rv2252/BmrU family lipid kinase